MSLFIRVVRLAHGADLPLPSYKTSGSAGMDLHAAICASLNLVPMERAVIATGLSIALPKGYEGQIRGRSGLALRYGIACYNAPGTIDSDYRGEIKVMLINLGKKVVTFEHGDRIAQLVISPVISVAWEEVYALEDTKRGTGSFGSTGLN
ncbi:deoxyuridine 5'-triphosphate nucleotidohydrolase [Candidatus Endolissoclinum faulkneri L5]|uniref:Deoxyuridine 5'-triphosphate nucleotidohydrolase n=1 Tax=Candidatus Endolissoclinum faulkneri L5 TaxID=1401328 RepID=V9TVN7_9PROT|nr:dUTP diphosphatase [Candidatus Endolissoclinum faulkneri]AHC73758.1 deoxyuridine 5'-triphosphate nucleotidohydrolase [Candidatus Endolissoclinum faulkneri L5]